MQQLITKLQPSTLLYIFALVAIIFGGMLSAFGASSPNRSTMWVSAFLVLVMGIGQYVLGSTTRRLNQQPKLTSALAATGLYNLGGLLIIIGTLLKANLHILVPLGSVLLVLSLIIHLKLSYRRLGSSWRHIYHLTVAILVISSLIGIKLSYS